jgi:hypothetical protein
LFSQNKNDFLEKIISLCSIGSSVFAFGFSPVYRSGRQKKTSDKRRFPEPDCPVYDS